MIVLTLEGLPRTARALKRKSDGSVFGYELTVITQRGNNFGETLRVTVFENQLKHADWVKKLADLDAPADMKNTVPPTIEWAVNVSATKYGLNAVFLQDLAEDAKRYGFPASKLDMSDVKNP